MILFKNLIRTLFKTNKRVNLTAILFSGQSFRWNLRPLLSQYYSNIIGNTLILLREIESSTIEVLSEFNTVSGLPIDEFIFRYFTLDIDEKKVFLPCFQSDFEEVWCLVKPYQSVRIMRQDPFEIMVTFMCAQGIGMHLIRRQVSMIMERYGQPHVLVTDDGEIILHGFPTPSALASAKPEELAVCTNNNRIRAANIIAMAQSIDSGKLDLSSITSANCPVETVREALCALSGIGLKIADCIALFGLGRFDAFPIDTHVKQYLWEWFGIEAARRSLTEKNYRFLQDEARKFLGNEYAGYAGHMLFHCWRTEVKKMKAF